MAPQLRIPLLAALARRLRRAAPRPLARSQACVPHSDLAVLLTMRGPDGMPFRCVEIGRVLAAPATSIRTEARPPRRRIA